MADEHGTSFCGVREAFGLDFIMLRVVGNCQMHYRNDVNKASAKVGRSFECGFKKICSKVCVVIMIVEYNNKGYLDEIVNLFPDIERWGTWWDARKYHIFPVFWKFCYSNVTLDESENSTLKCRHSYGC